MRLISAAVGIVLGVAILILDNLFVYCAAISFLSAVAVWELTRAIKCDKFTVLRWTSIVFGAVFPIIISISQIKFLAVPAAMLYVIVMALIMLKFHKEVRFEQVLACGAAGGLLPVALCSITLLRYSAHGEGLGTVSYTHLKSSGACKRGARRGRVHFDCKRIYFLRAGGDTAQSEEENNS